MTLGDLSPATSETAPSRSVAGLDLLMTREADADHLARDLSARVSARGGHDATVAGHWAVVGTLRHVAMTVDVAGLDPGGLADVLDDVARRAGTPFGRLVADEFRGERELRPVVEGALVAARERRSGRVIVFPGSTGLVGTIPIGHVLATSAIERVHVLANGTCTDDTLLVTRDFVRPRWQFGDLVLHVQPAAGGTLVPFETPNPTPCCADHA